MMYRFVSVNGKLTQKFFEAAMSEKESKESEKGPEICDDLQLVVTHDSWEFRLNWNGVADSDAQFFAGFIKNVYPYMTEPQINRLKKYCTDYIERPNCARNLEKIIKKQSKPVKVPFSKEIKFVLNHSNVDKINRWLLTKEHGNIYLCNGYQVMKISDKDYQDLKTDILDLPCIQENEVYSKEFYTCKSLMKWHKTKESANNRFSKMVDESNINNHQVKFTDALKADGKMLYRESVGAHFGVDGKVLDKFNHANWYFSNKYRGQYYAVTENYTALISGVRIA